MLRGSMCLPGAHAFAGMGLGPQAEILLCRANEMKLLLIDPFPCSRQSSQNFVYGNTSRLESSHSPLP